MKISLNCCNLLDGEAEGVAEELNGGATQATLEKADHANSVDLD